jgi:hypothetical protein
MYQQMIKSTFDSLEAVYFRTARAKVLVPFLETIQSKRHIVFLSLAACLLSNERVLSGSHVQAVMLVPTGRSENIIFTTNCLFVFLALQPIVFVFSTAR